MGTALISGATGLVGRHLLSELIGSSRYERVIALVRRQTGENNEKLKEIVIDFEKLSAGLDGFSITHSFCCLGTTISKAGTKEAQFKIDHDYVVSFARASLALGAECFVVISSVGADSRSRNFYLNTKGRMEQDVIDVPFTRVVIMRPSFIVGDRTEFRLGEKVGMGIARALSFLMIGALEKYRPVEARTVAKAMLHASQESDAPRVRVYESNEIAQIGRIS